MDNMNQKEMRQYRIMLDGALSKDYREYLSRKLLMFEYLIELLKECRNDSTEIT